MGCGISHADVFAPVPIERAPSRQSSLDRDAECDDRTEAEFREQLGLNFIHKFAQSKDNILRTLTALSLQSRATCSLVLQSADVQRLMVT